VIRFSWILSVGREGNRREKKVNNMVSNSLWCGDISFDREIKFEINRAINGWKTMGKTELKIMAG
jgi:hypothetical protein